MTKIEWTEKTWNPVTGCTKISAGCQNCYAERMAKRLQHMGVDKYSNGFDVTCHPDALDIPRKRKKPTMYFVNSMSDLFHDDVPDEFIRKVFAIMNECTQHTFQVLTKRPERAFSLSQNLEAIYNMKAQEGLSWSSNIWYGISVSEGDKSHVLALLPAGYVMKVSVPFVSFEPLISKPSQTYYWRDSKMRGDVLCSGERYLFTDAKWIIVGGETGPGARIMKKEWVEEIYEVCRRYNIPFFFKGWGTATMKKSDPEYRKFMGKEWNEIPEGF